MTLIRSAALPLTVHRALQVEHFEIYSFVAEKVRAGASGCMFVSGVPGTGKTATVRAVANQLRREKDSGGLPRFQVRC